MLTIIRNAGQIPRGTSSPGNTIFNLEVIGMFSLPAYEKWGCWLLLFCTVSSFIRIAFLSIRFPCQPCFNWFLSLGLPTAGVTTGGRGTLVDFTKTLTIPLFFRARWCGSDEKEALAAEERFDEQHCVDVDDATTGVRVRRSGRTSIVAFWASPLLNNNRGMILCQQYQRAVPIEWCWKGRRNTRQLTSILPYWHAVRISESMVDGMLLLVLVASLRAPLTTCCFWRTVSHADVITLPATTEAESRNLSVLRPSASSVERRRPGPYDHFRRHPSLRSYYIPSPPPSTSTTNDNNLHHQI